MNVLPVTALAAVAALATSTGTASAGIRAFHAVASEHLYVAGYANQQLEVQRFPFVNGFPSRTPDLTYQNVTTPIAVGRNGTFYATVPLSCCYGLGMIDVFAPNSNVVARQITLPNLHEDTTIDTALVEGPRAYLYVGYAAFISGGRTRRDPGEKQGIAVYPPGANGGGRPLRMFHVPRDNGGPETLAFDRLGLLYVATGSGDDLHNRVYTVDDPLTQPRVVSALDLPSSYNAWGIDFSDGGRNMYALTYGAAPGPAIAVYPYGSHGNAPPSRTIDLAPSAIFTTGLGIAGEHAYVGVYSGPPAVLAYKKHASGQVSPVFTLTLSSFTSAEGIAVGP